jgi:hypothetical protein
MLSCGGWFESASMSGPTDLLGRDTLVREVRLALIADRSVLLYGPEGVGKSAIVSAVGLDRVVVIDPFERITRRQAAEIRRALDRGFVYLAAARAAQRRQLGAVGRILWRFLLVRVRELPDAVVKRLVVRELGTASDYGPEPAWLAETVALARGRPGFAVEMARFAAQWKSRRGYLPMPAFAFAAMREDTVIRKLQRGDGVHADERHSKEHP